MISLDAPLLDVLKRDDWEEVLEFLRVEYVWQDNLLMVRYNMADQPQWEYLAARQSRGPIIDMNTMKYVCRGFDKFFNIGEAMAPVPHPETPVRATEKIDGSIIKVWLYKGEMKISTNGSIDGMRRNSNHGLSLGELFLEALGEEARKELLDLMYSVPSHTHMFELVSPLAQIVVEYPETRVYYLGSRENECGQHWQFYFALDEIWMPAAYIISYAEAIENLDRYGSEEGLVIEWGLETTYQVKLKKEDYLQKHYLFTATPKSPRKLVDLYMLGEADEITAYLPQYKVIFDDIKFCESLVRENITSIAQELLQQSPSDDKVYSVAKEVCSTLTSPGRYTGLVMSAYRGNTLPYIKVNKLIVDEYVKLIQDRV